MKLEDVLGAVVHQVANLIPCFEAQVSKFQKRLVLPMVDLADHRTNLTLEIYKLINLSIDLVLGIDKLENQKAMERLEKLKAACADKVNRELELRAFIDALAISPLVLDAWDERLWQLLVIKGVVGRDGSIEFEFRNAINTEAMAK